MQNICLFTKTEFVAPTIAPNPKFPRCYEQMSKLRFSWWASYSVRNENGSLEYRERGPFASYADACRFAGR